MDKSYAAQKIDVKNAKKYLKYFFKQKVMKDRINLK